MRGGHERDANARLGGHGRAGQETRGRGMETRELMKACRWQGWEPGQMGGRVKVVAQQLHFLRR